MNAGSRWTWGTPRSGDGEHRVHVLQSGITVDELMSNADRAMYTAKYRGKDRYEQFEEWMLASVEPV